MGQTIIQDEAAEVNRGFGDRRPSVAAAEAVAAFRGVDPTELADCLNDYVNTDALDALLQSRIESPITATFQMRELIVELTNEGRIDVRETGD